MKTAAAVRVACETLRLRMAPVAAKLLAAAATGALRNETKVDIAAPTKGASDPGFESAGREIVFEAGYVFTRKDGTPY